MEEVKTLTACKKCGKGYSYRDLRKGLCKKCFFREERATETSYERAIRKRGERFMESSEGKEMIKKLKDSIKRAEDKRKQEEKEKELIKQNSTIKLFEEKK